MPGSRPRMRRLRCRKGQERERDRCRSAGRGWIRSDGNSQAASAVRRQTAGSALRRGGDGSVEPDCRWGPTRQRWKRCRGFRRSRTTDGSGCGPSDSAGDGCARSKAWSICCRVNSGAAALSSLSRRDARASSCRMNKTRFLSIVRRLSSISTLRTTTPALASRCDSRSFSRK